jgi:hypothetical protein
MASHLGRNILVVLAAAGAAGLVGYMVRHRQELEEPAEFAPSVWITPAPQT